ncbi:FAD-dependent oxidoreductase [Arthrobacter castelli]|uniref:FAD-dependent oxidoreductase n=1 Tax=Arthrobacter castelli TaxID=271431 RepID=UPI00041FEBE7|nr:FAD-dependent oxidoreductase [Arthrobacter castelli]
MKRIVVVGNGIAGTTASDTLRSEGFDGELIVVGGESHSPYSRPALSKAAVAGGDGPDPDSVYLPEFTHGATEYLGVQAVSLRVGEQELVLADGRTLQFDGLVITTGARPHRFTDSGSEFNLRTLDHAFALRKRLSERPAVTVLGGGALGMEVASGARDMGCEVWLFIAVRLWPVRRGASWVNCSRRGPKTGESDSSMTSHGMYISSPPQKPRCGSN